MTPESQRIAIAEACGWRGVSQGIGPNSAIVLGNEPTSYGYRIDQRVPDYLNNLNAMHEAEKVILRMHGDEYRMELMAILGIEWGHASAAQRAEAFLRTIGGWIDSQ